VTSPYATDKLSAYPDVIQSLSTTGDGRLLTVHLMPQNVCNQRCAFCSYRMEGNKNSQHFDEGEHLPLDILHRTLDTLADMDVQGIELTGGGEPLAYPRISTLLRELWARKFAVGLVTNGTLYHRAKADIHEMGDALRWVRVSIDAASPSTYSAMRQAPAAQFSAPWDMVRDLAAKRGRFHPEFAIGVGFVLCNENIGQVRKFCEMARDTGADNVRLSMTFSDRHLDFFDDRDALVDAVSESLRAVQDLESPTFRIHNLLPVRYAEQHEPAQDYKRCPTKDVLCVIEGSGNVYSCCTFTGTKKGLWGNIIDDPDGFRGVWGASADRRRSWDARVECQVACLYRQRNLAMNDLVDSHVPITHREFI
jgi:molybdenum cofactor biosynthesis enzyme MoaA